jgi:hypothetical protein
VERTSGAANEPRFLHASRAPQRGLGPPTKIHNTGGAQTVQEINIPIFSRLLRRLLHLVGTLDADTLKHRLEYIVDG